MSLLDMFKVTTDLSVLAEDPSITETSNANTTLRVGKESQFRGSINGIEVPCYVTLHEAKLSRVSLIKQTSPNLKRDYFLATGIFKPVKLDLYVKIDGEKMNIIDLLHAFINEKAERKISRDEFVQSASNVGMDFVGGMPLFFQQFGANIDGWNNLIEKFTAAGAANVAGMIKQNSGRIQQAFASEEGVSVTEFELGTTDRSQSRTGQGFLNLTDSIVNQFERIITLRKEAKILGAQPAEDEKQSSITKRQDLAKDKLRLARQWNSNWAGAQLRLDPTTKKPTTPVTYDPVSAPCGRFTLHGHAIDLWSNSAVANTSGASLPTVSNDFEISTDEPF
jgi:hypothetical protein